MIDPGFEILNQRGTPMFFSDVFANRPTAGVVGRIFISTDTYAFYRDTGTTWDLIGGPGTGTITGSISAGQVAYGTAANTIGGSNNLYFDSASNRLGIGTTSPTATLSVVGTGQFSGNVTIVNNANVLTRLNVQNDTIGALSRAGIYLSSDILSGNATFGKNSSGGTSYFTTSPTDTYIENSGYGDITIQNAVSGGRIKFSGGGASTSQMTLFSTGNLGIGVGLTDSGQRLQVTGNVNFGGASGLTWDNTNGRLGIGVTAPTTKLEVSVTGNNGIRIANSGNTGSDFSVLDFVQGGLQKGVIYTNNDIMFVNSSQLRLSSTGANPMLFSTNGSERMRLDASGNLGLGVTPSAWRSTERALQIGTYTSVTDVFGYSTFGNNYFVNASSQNIFLNSARASVYTQNAGVHAWLTSTTSGTAGGVVTFTQAMTLDASGNLGLGVTPSAWGLSFDAMQFGFGGAVFGNIADNATYISSNYFTNGAGQDIRINTGFVSVLRQSVGAFDFFTAPSGAAGSNASLTQIMKLNSTGNLLIGTTTDAGFKLDVNGTMRVSGASTMNDNLTLSRTSTLRLTLQSTDSSILFNDTTAVSSARNWGIFTSDVTEGDFNIKVSTTNGVAPTISALYFNSSGAATFSSSVTAASFIPSASTIPTNGMYLPTTNTIGWATNSAERMRLDASGNLLLGSSTAFTANERLQVTGTQQNKHAVTYSTGPIQSFRIQKDLTIGSGATISTASTLSNGIFTGDNVFGGSVSVPASSPFANIYAANYYQFSAAGVTVTQDQAAGGSRALSQYYAQNYFKGTNSGTITHMASMQIAGYYNNNTGSITPVITNAYQLLINDINEYAHTFTLTNRWGIYQEGASDRNYMAGKLMLNTTTDTGQRIQINGDIRIDGQLSGTAGGSSGQHLIINCDGTTYKIALLNN